MKKHLMLILGLVLVIISCKKEASQTDDNTLLQYNQKLKKATSVVGRVHNEGVTAALSLKAHVSGPNLLQSLFPTVPSNPDPTPSYYTSQDIKTMINSIYDYVLSQPEFAGSSRGVISQVVPSIISIVYASSATSIDMKVDSAVAVLRQNSIITIREAGMIKELQDIFLDGYALNMTQANAGPYFATKLDQLKTKYANIVWEINEGEAFLGALEIAISSNQYWHYNTTQPVPSLSRGSQEKLMSLNKTANIPLPPFTPDDPETPIIQIDLVAYLLHWSWDVYNQAMAGTLDESGQSARISGALQAAITASTLRWIKLISVAITTDMFDDLGGSPIGGDPTVLHFPTPLTTDPVFYTNEYSYIGSNYRPPFLTTRIYNQGDFYYYDANLTNILPDGYYILQEDLQYNNYYQITNGKVSDIGTANNDPNAPVAPYTPYNPFGPGLAP